MPDFIFFLFIVLLLAGSVFVYRFIGKKEFARFDFVQFVYAFVVAPIVFIWFKTFLHGLLQDQTELSLSPQMIFMIDTAFSVYFLYIFAFIVIHSLTKSFRVKMLKNPLHDLFYHSEYFHLWLTHVITFAGGMVTMAFFAAINAFVPANFVTGANTFYLIISLAITSGIAFFIALWMSDPRQDEANFMRIMKLVAAVLFILLVGVYFGFNPEFSSEYVFFWFGLFAFASIVSCSAFAYKSVRAKNFFERVVERFIPKDHLKDHFKNIQLFKKRKA